MLQSIVYASKGIRYTFMHEKNFRLEIYIAILVVLLGICFKLNNIEWLFICSAIFRVLSYETVNTSVESLSDVCEKKKDIDIRHIKDTSAAYVLLSVMYSIVIGLVIFTPKIINLW